jgi:hypothetical protein
MAMAVLVDQCEWSGIEGVNYSVSKLPQVISQIRIRSYKIVPDEGAEPLTRQRDIGAHIVRERLDATKNRDEGQIRGLIGDRGRDAADIDFSEGSQGVIDGSVFNHSAPAQGTALSVWSMIAALRFIIRSAFQPPVTSLSFK